MKPSSEQLETIVTEFADFMMPELTPYESILYLILFRKSYMANGTQRLTIGKRTLAELYGQGSKGERTNMQYIGELARRLEEKGCIIVQGVQREGTTFEIRLPREIPWVVERMVSARSDVQADDDYYTDPEKRLVVFERDRWTCQYCGELLNHDKVTLDHLIPVCKGGRNTLENLKTCCFPCNSLKSGKTYEEAAPHILRRIKGTRAKAPDA